MKWSGSSVPRGMKPQLHEDQTNKPNPTFIFPFEGQPSTRMRCNKFTLGHRTAVSLHIGLWPRGTNSTVVSWVHNLIKNCELNGHSVQGTGRDAQRLLSTWMENTPTHRKRNLRKEKWSVGLSQWSKEPKFNQGSEYCQVMQSEEARGDGVSLESLQLKWAGETEQLNTCWGKSVLMERVKKGRHCGVEGRLSPWE